MRTCLKCGLHPRRPGKRMRVCQSCHDVQLRCACGADKAFGAQSCQPCYFKRMPRGADHLRWKGGRVVTSEGYIRVHAPGHPRAHHGTVLEHVLVMEQHLGRPLLPEENVHHVNGARGDNRLENLELWSKSQPAGQRVAEKVRWAKSLISIYEVPAADQQGRLPIVIDFDGTLAESLWTPENPTTKIGPPLSANLAKARDAARAGWEIVVYTARAWADEPMLRKWLIEHEVPFRSVICSKPLAALYVDDRGCHASAESWLPQDAFPALSSTQSDQNTSGVDS